MDEQKPQPQPQSEIERLRAELIEHWEYGNKIPRVFSESLAAFESAIRAESEAEIKQIEGFEELVESSNAVNAELEKVVAALDKMDIPQFKDFDALSAHERIQALSRIIEDTRDEIGRLEQEQATLAFQGTPTPEQIEAHAKAWPAEKKGGYWLELEDGERGMYAQITILAIIEGVATFYNGCLERWEPLIDHETVRYLPLQPNGIPVGMSAKVEPATSSPKPMTVAEKLNELMARMDELRTESAALDKEFWRIKSVPESEWNPGALYESELTPSPSTADALDERVEALIRELNTEDDDYIAIADDGTFHFTSGQVDSSVWKKIDSPEARAAVRAWLGKGEAP